MSYFISDQTLVCMYYTIGPVAEATELPEYGLG